MCSFYPWLFGRVGHSRLTIISQFRRYWFPPHTPPTQYSLLMIRSLEPIFIFLMGFCDKIRVCSDIPKSQWPKMMKFISWLQYVTIPGQPWVLFHTMFNSIIVLRGLLPPGALLVCGSWKMRVNCTLAFKAFIQNYIHHFLSYLKSHGDAQF